jgi:hypothetical protein
MHDGRDIKDILQEVDGDNVSVILFNFEKDKSDFDRHIKLILNSNIWIFFKLFISLKLIQT